MRYRHRTAAASALALLLTASLVFSGCTNNIGDVGQKDIRTKTSEYEKNGNRINGVHTYGSPGYRTRSAEDRGNAGIRQNGQSWIGNRRVSEHDNVRLEMNSRLAASLEAMPEVQRAYVLVTDRNAYVGLITAGSTGMQGRATEANLELKDKVSGHVRAAVPLVQNVYVTSNPDFLARMQHYTDALRAGYPMQGFLTEFNALAVRVFPGTTSAAGGRR